MLSGWSGSGFKTKTANLDYEILSSRSKQASPSLSFFSAWYLAFRFLKKSGEQTSRCLYSSSGSRNRSCFPPCRRKPLQRTATREWCYWTKNWLCIWLLCIFWVFFFIVIYRTVPVPTFYFSHKYPRKARIRMRFEPDASKTGGKLILIYKITGRRTDFVRGFRLLFTVFRIRIRLAFICICGYGSRSKSWIWIRIQIRFGFNWVCGYGSGSGIWIRIRI